jgi:hypothetical protein
MQPQEVGLKREKNCLPLEWVEGKRRSMKLERLAEPNVGGLIGAIGGRCASSAVLSAKADQNRRVKASLLY